MTTTNNMKIGLRFPEVIAVFDTETTSPDPQEARLVTAFIGLIDTATGLVTDRWSWVVNPGVPIPKEASDIHGYTTERVLVEGGDPKQAVFEITQRLDIIHKDSIAIVAMNAVYDFTVMDREVERYWPGMRPLIEGVWEFVHPDTGEWSEKPPADGADPALRRWRLVNSPVIFDPMILDRAFDKYRRGSRKLVDLAAFYGVPVATNAHDAEADCMMAGAVAIKLMGHARLAELSLSEVHDKLVVTKRNQAIDLMHFWKDKRLPQLRGEERTEMMRRIENVKTVGHYWPLIPRGVTS